MNKTWTFDGDDVSNFCMSGRRCSRSPLGGRLAMTLLANISMILFFHDFSVVISPSRPFVIEGVPESKNLFREDLKKTSIFKDIVQIEVEPLPPTLILTNLFLTKC